MQKEIEDFIKRHLTLPKWPDLCTPEWDAFIKREFTREGVANNEAYSSQVNELLSRAAFYTALEEIAKLMRKELLEEPQTEGLTVPS